MKEKIIDLKYGKLHLIKTKKFRTINIKVVLKDIVKKEDITKRNFLTDYLTLTTKKYNTKRALALKTQDLYSVFISAYNARLGNFLVTKFDLSLLDPKYTEDSMLESSIDLLHEIIFNPNVSNGMFKTEFFNVIKKDIEMEIATLHENSKLYANTKMLEILGKNEPYSYHGFGYLEDLETITPKNLYEYYKEFIKKADVDIYVCGDLEEEKVINIVNQKLNFKTLKKEKGSILLGPLKASKKIKEVVEESTFSQSKLAIGCKIGDLTEFQFKYVLNIYNMILGGGFNSKFMQEIREEESLAYYITSSINKADSTMLIQSGISYKNYHKVVSKVKDIMKRISKGDISDEEIKSAKIEYLSIIDENHDNIENIVESNIIKDLLNLDDFDTRKEKIKEVTREDIMEVSKKINIDTIYLLKGDDDGKD